MTEIKTIGKVTGKVEIPFEIEAYLDDFKTTEDNTMIANLKMKGIVFGEPEFKVDKRD